MNSARRRVSGPPSRSVIASPVSPAALAYLQPAWLDQPHGAAATDAAQGGGGVVVNTLLNAQQAGELLGVGWDFWSEHVAPTLPIAQDGRRKLGGGAK